MPRGTHSIEINASCDAVFELIHNYDIRLQWDSMLCEATLLGAAAEVVKGVRTRCVGNWKCLWLAIEADYLSYEKGKVAAVKCLISRCSLQSSRPPFVMMTRRMGGPKSLTFSTSTPSLDT